MLRAQKCCCPVSSRYDLGVMFSPDRENLLQGEHLRCLIDEVRQEFLARDARQIGEDYIQVNSVKLVLSEVFAALSVDAKVAITTDLVRLNEESDLRRRPEEVFSSSDSAPAYISDLICELVHQELLNYPEIRLENDYREALAD
jgi:hypothetical protein